MPLTSAELENHPEFPYLTWNLKPDQKSKVAVAKGRGGPFNIAYEIHGHGPRHIVWLMGLGAFMTNWQRQTKDFGHTQAETYSCLILDNRGMGESDKPLMRYSTSEMAKDVVEVLDHIGWTTDRSVHVIGISMGGMIAQELALQVPNHICSLSLVSTAARLVNTVSFMENLRDRINLFLPKSVDAQIAQTKYMIYTPSFLDSPDESEYTKQAFPTAGDRVGAGELAKRRQPQLFTRKGFVSQAIAAGWHHKSAEELRRLADAVGRRRIMVIHGTVDRMISVPHGEVLVEELNMGGKDGEGVRKEMFEGINHVIPIEKRKEFQSLVEGLVEATEAMN